MNNVNRGRKVKYTEERKREILQEYEKATDKKAFARQLGISFKSLYVYIWKWKKELGGKEPVDISYEEPGPDVPF